MLYSGSCASHFYALDKRTGDEKWKYDIRKDGNQTSFRSEPLVAEDMILVGTDGGRSTSAIGHVYAFNKSDGQVRWKHQVRYGVPTDIVRQGALVYAVTLSDELICLDLATGKLRWNFASKSVVQDERLISHAPAVADGRVFFGSLQGIVHAFAAESGKPVWQRDLGTAVTATPMVHDGHLYVGTADGRLHSISVRTGEVTGSLSLDGAINGTLLIADRSLLVLHGRDDQDLTLSAIDPALKRIIWQQTNNWCTSRPHYRRGLALMGNRRGEVVAVKPSDGTQLWTQKLRGPMRGVTSDDEMIYAATQRGIIYAFTAK